MKSLKFIAMLFSLSAILSASPAVMGGITYHFGGSSSDALKGAGATIKVLSTGKDKKPVVAAGVSYYPWASDSKKFGLDISAGYTVKHSAVMGGWDFLQKQPTVSLGYNKEINAKGSEFGDDIQDARCKK